jgi:hypothetical protein
MIDFAGNRGTPRRDHGRTVIVLQAAPRCDQLGLMVIDIWRALVTRPFFSMYLDSMVFIMNCLCVSTR